MSTEPHRAFLARQPIVDRLGAPVGYELLYRAAGDARQASFDDEDAASLHVLSTMLHELGAAQVLAGGRAFVNVGPGSLGEAGALLLADPRRTVLELSAAVRPDAATLERVGRLREMGFGIAVSAAPPIESLAPWLPLATHLKVDLARVPDARLEVFVATLRYGPHVLVAEKVETAAQARRCVELGFHALQGWHVGPPETMGSVRLGADRRVLDRVAAQLAAGAPLERIESAMRADPALCWRLLRYVAASNFGLLVPVDSLRHALELVGRARLARWLQLVRNTVPAPTPAAAGLSRAAVTRGRLLELVGADWFSGVDADNLYLVGALSLLPAMLMQPMAEAIASLALPESVADALALREGRFGPLVELAEALEAGHDERVEALCARLAMSEAAIVRARRCAEAAAHDPVLA